MILQRIGFRPSRRQRLGHRRIDRSPAFLAERKQHLRRFMRIGNAPRREAGKTFMRQQHDVDCVGKADHLRAVIGKVIVPHGTDRFVKGDGSG